MSVIFLLFLLLIPFSCDKAATMRVTRSDTAKKIEEAKNFFGLPLIGSDNKSMFNRVFKKKVNSGDKTDEGFSFFK